MSSSSTTLAQALTLQKQGRVTEAVSVYREVLAREPLNGDALHLMGLAMATLGQTQEAVRLIGAAVQLQPSNAAAHANLATALSGTGDHAEALPCYDRALALQPDMALAHRGRGAALLALGQLEAAQASFRAALRLAPNDDQAVNALGVALERVNRPAEARQCFNRAITLNPANADAHHNLGLIEAAAGRHAEALASFERVLALAPEATSTHLWRGKMCLELGRPAEALASFDRAALLAPYQFDGHFQRGVALALLERYDESLASFSTAATLNANSADAVNNRGAVLVRLFRPAEALRDFGRALELRPDYADAFLNAGIALRGLGRYQEALDNLERALAIRPDDPTATWTKALLKLALGEFREGWPLYESRARLPRAQKSQRTFAAARWTGSESLADRTLLVYADQGLGDTVQFCRYVPLLEAMGAKVVFEVQPALKPLLSSLTIRGRLIGRGEPLPACDLQVPLLSLPLALGTELDTIPAGVPYLHADPAAVQRWVQRLAAFPGCRVALNWQGDTQAEKLSALEARSFPLAAAAPLAQLAGVSLISLQKGPAARQLSEVEFGGKVAQLTDPLHMGPEEIATETAAIIMGVDLVITCDTAVAHLAAALGARVWVILQAVPDWRWLIERDDSPWYPTMRLFRQRTPGDWPEVFERVAAEVAVLARTL